MRDGGEITKKGEKGAGEVGVKDRERVREGVGEVGDGSKRSRGE